MAPSPANSHGNGYPLALAGAVSATRFVGGTATVAPTTGTFAVGDFVISQNGKLWVCTVAGSPGTWVQIGGGAAGTVYDYAEFTAQVNVTATTEGTAVTVKAGNSVTYDGSTTVLIECFTPKIVPGGAEEFYGVILVDSTVLGQFTLGYSLERGGRYGAVKHTPAAGAHTYTWKAFGSGSTGTINPGAGGSGNMVPGYIRVIAAPAV